MSTTFDAAASETAATGWTRPRLTIALLIALAFAFDGFDSTLLGLTVAQVSRDLGISLSGFAVIFAVSLGGMAAGTLASGLAGDRFGRKWPTIASLLLFGTFTALASLASDAISFALLRIIAAMALGGLLPNGTAFIAELAPARWRGASVMMVVMTMSIGQIFSGLIVAQVGGAIGWRGLFAIGGMLPIVHGLYLMWRLPESPGFLATRPERRKELATTLRRFKLPAPSVAQGLADAPRLGIGDLFSIRFRRDTLALIFSFFFEMLCTYSVNSWLPTAIKALNLPEQAIGLTTACYHTGSVVGIPIGILAVSRFGSRRLLPTLGTLAAVGAFGLATLQLAPSIAVLGALLMVVAGANAIIVVSLYSLCVEVYPTAIRASGVGVVGAIGRVGALSSSAAGAYAIALGGAQGFFVLLGGAAALTAVGLAMLRTSLKARGEHDPSSEA